MKEKHSDLKRGKKETLMFLKVSVQDQQHHGSKEQTAHIVRAGEFAEHVLINQVELQQHHLQIRALVSEILQDYIFFVQQSCKAPVKCNQFLPPTSVSLTTMSLNRHQSLGILRR